MILVTGGAGFIGSHFVNRWTGEDIVIVDKMSYAADQKRVTNPRARILRENIRSSNAMIAVLRSAKPRAVFHFAAETHVTKSITDPAVFFKNNVDGTLNLLEAVREYWDGDETFRFVHVSTDEVFGNLGPGDAPFTEDSPHRPSTPYAASKAAADHIARCFHVTYALPVLIVNSTNNYGIGQHREKLIPLVISAALKQKPITVHGDGLGTRDWIHVEDFCDAITTVFHHGTPGEAYCVGARNERSVMDIVTDICAHVHELTGTDPLGLVTHVQDRPGNDKRYAVDPQKIMRLGWTPRREFDLMEIVKHMA